MTLIKTSLLNGIAVVIKMLTMLGLNKILAIYVGPAGYAAIGNFQNAVQLCTALASSAINTGVTKYTAEYYQDELRQYTVWRTAALLAFVGSLIVAILVVIFNKLLAEWFLKDESLGSVFIWFALTLMFFVFNGLLLAILNGKKEIKRYVAANIAGSLFALVITSFMALKLGLYGALVALAIYQSLTFFVTLLLTYNSSWFRLSYFFGSIDHIVLKNLLRFSLMALVSVAVGPTATLIIRTYIFETIGADSAGLWEAMQRLGGAYIMFFTSVLSVYLLPKFSELKNIDNIVSEIKLTWCLLIPASIFSAFLLYCLRDFVIVLLFSKDFLDMSVLFAWHLIGEVFRLASWVLAFIMISKSMFKLFIITEILFNFSYLSLTLFFVDAFGVVGATTSYAMIGFIYLVSLLYIFFRSGKYSFYKNRKLYE